MGHLSRRLARCTSVRGRPESRGSAVVRAHSSKNRARNRLVSRPNEEGSGSVDPRPFLPLTGYALGLSRRLTWVTVSEEKLGRLTIDLVGRLTEEQIDELRSP